MLDFFEVAGRFMLIILGLVTCSYVFIATIVYTGYLLGLVQCY